MSKQTPGSKSTSHSNEPIPATRETEPAQRVTRERHNTDSSNTLPLNQGGAGEVKYATKKKPWHRAPQH